MNVTEIPSIKPIKNRRVAAYCRVSTGSEDQLVSLDAQKKHYEELITSEPDWLYAGLYYDEGVSGTGKDKRSGLLRLLADCENRKIDLIVTKSVSRFARNVTDCLGMVRKLTSLNVEVFFESENIRTGSMDGELMLTVLSSLAESESVSTSENNQWGMTHRFQTGSFKPCSAPYGYDYADGELKVNKSEAEIVKRIFSEAVQGKGTQKIADGLNKDGIPAKRGNHWAQSTVSRILRNEKYTGDSLLQKTYTEQFKRHTNKGAKDRFLIENSHEAIVSREMFLKAAAALRQRGEAKGIERDNGKYLSRYPFSGKIRCGVCGDMFKRRMHGSGNNRYAAWCCRTHLKDKGRCSVKFIRDDAIKKAFAVMMERIVQDKSVVKNYISELKAKEDSSLQSLEEKIKANTERIQVLTALLSQGYLEPALFHAQTNELQTEGIALKQQKEAVQLRNSRISEGEKLMKFKPKTVEYDDAVFERFAESMVVDQNREVRLHLKCGLVLSEVL